MPIPPSLLTARAALDALLADTTLLATFGALPELLARAFSSGHKVLICGNGGSACDAMHFAEEFTGRFRKERPPLPALALTDAGHITCTANDYGFEHVFSRAVEAFGRPGDVLILLSTSGNSANIIKAAEAGRARALVTIGLTGPAGGLLKSRGLCDHLLAVPGDAPDRVQELHMLLLHALIEGVERVMFPGNYA